MTQYPAELYYNVKICLVVIGPDATMNRRVNELSMGTDT